MSEETGGVGLGKVLYLTLMAIFVPTLGFMTFNVEGMFDIALPYLALLIGGLVIWSVGRGISVKKGKGLDFPDPTTVEKETIIGKLSPKMNLALYFLFIILAGFIFFNTMAKTGFQILAAPELQFLPLTLELNAVVTIIFAFVEELVVIAIPASIAYKLTKHVSGNKAISLVLAVFVTMLVFTSYHIGRYGPAQAMSMEAVMTYAVLSSVVLLTTRNIFFMSMIHSSNNLALTFAKYYAIANPMIYAVVFMMIVGLFAVFAVRKTGGGKLEI